MTKILRILTLFFLAILAVASPPDTTAQGVRRLSLDVAENEGLISYEAHGRGYASGGTVDLTVTNLSGSPLEVVIPPGMLFLPAGAAASALSENRGTVLKPTYAQLDVKQKAFFANNPQNEGLLPTAGSQGLGAAGEVGAGDFVMCFSCGATLEPLEPETQNVIIEAYCVNAHLDNPSESTLLRAFSPPEDDFTRLMRFYSAQNQPASVIALQIATWIITDDVDMDFLIAVGYEPTPQELDEAINLLLDAGIDISGKQLGPRPALIAPADGSTTTNPQLTMTWTPISGAVSYEVALDIVNGTPTPNIFSGYSVGTTFKPPAPLYAATFYWAVRGVNRNGNPFPWSDTRSFTVLSLPNAAPVRNLYTTHQPRLTWNHVSWATGYQVQISKTSNFTGNTIISDVLSPDELFWVTDYLGNGTWFWHVRARRTDGVTWGSWSAAEPFHVFVP
jgi:hypothetical protein